MGAATLAELRCGIELVTDAITRRSFTALVGSSDGGKSSVVLAGLAPRLLGTDGWRAGYFRIATERDPFLALARAIVPLYVTSENDTDRLSNARRLAARLQSGELALLDVFEDYRTGERVLTASDDGTARIWEAPPAANQALLDKVLQTLGANAPTFLNSP